MIDFGLQITFFFTLNDIWIVVKSISLYYNIMYVCIYKFIPLEKVCMLMMNNSLWRATQEKESPGPTSEKEV